MSLWQMVLSGGPIMIPIILCGALTLAIIVEKLLSFHHAEIDAEKFIVEIEEVLKRRKMKEALDFCDRYPRQPVPAIIKAGLLKSDRSREEIREAVEDAAAQEIPELERYLGILATMGTVTPLLGLLGTTTGLMQAFMVIQTQSGPVNPSMLAQGVWQALVTTAGGLGVAIPCYLAYNYFVSRVNGIILLTEKSATRILDIFLLLKTEDE